MIILNKTDQLQVPQIEKVRMEIDGEINRGVPIIQAAYGKVSPDILLGINAAAESDVDNRISHHENEVEHDHDDFESFVIDFPEVSDTGVLHNRIVSVAEQHGALRVKGFVKIKDKPLNYLVQAVGRRVNGHFEPRSGTHGNLVVIGKKGLDRQAIKKILAG